MVGQNNDARRDIRLDERGEDKLALRREPEFSRDRSVELLRADKGVAFVPEQEYTAETRSQVDLSRREPIHEYTAPCEPIRESEAVVQEREYNARKTQQVTRVINRDAMDRNRDGQKVIYNDTPFLNRILAINTEKITYRTNAWANRLGMRNVIYNPPVNPGEQLMAGVGLFCNV